MGAYESMKKQLKKTGLYTLDGKTAVDFELKAYARGLDAVYDALSLLQNESFVNTASGYGLENREAAFHLDSSGTLEERRAAVLKLGSVTENSFTKDSLVTALSAWGLSVSIAEDTAAQKITVKFLKKPSCGQEKAVKILALLAPAHLTVKTDFSSAT